MPVRITSGDPTLVPPLQDELELPLLPDGLGFREEHQILRDSARRWLGERCPFAEVRRLVDDPVGFDPAVHRELCELGWLAVTEADRAGGGGLDHLALALLLEEMGRALLPGPYFASLLALIALEHAGSASQRARWCGPLSRGELIGTVAWSEPGGAWEPSQVSARAEPVDGGWTLHGTKTHLLFGASAGLVIVPCREPGGTTSLFCVELPNPRAVLTPSVCVDSTRRTARLELDALGVAEPARLERDGRDALFAVQVAGAALLAAEMVGASEALLERTRAYACERHQFGRAIGSFQAVKHPLVDWMVGTELARSLALAAASLLDAGPRVAEVAARMAKSQASDVLAFAARKGVQLHGGFGFTWDADVHFYFKRALWSRATLGDGPHHRRHLAMRLLGPTS